VAVGFALPLGLLAAARPRSTVDRIARLVSLLGVCVPSFWLGPLLILVFSIQLGLAAGVRARRASRASCCPR
jgi:peptide/nickel transport system permease protein